MEFKKRKKTDIHLDMTPILDTVFILLIFFAVSFNFTHPTTLKINLPAISEKQTATSMEPEHLKIQVTEQGTIYINNTKTDPEHISRVLKTIKQKNTFNKVIIAADYNVKHGEIVMLMGTCKEAGFSKISIAAQSGISSK